jgi:hypothetical protein
LSLGDSQGKLEIEEELEVSLWRIRMIRRFILSESVGSNIGRDISNTETFVIVFSLS